MYQEKVTHLFNFGAFCEIRRGKDGLVHISELADHRVASVEDVVKMGDEITVKVIGIDDMGRVNLSLRAMLDKSPQAPEDNTGDIGPPPNNKNQHDFRYDRNRGSHKPPFNKKG